MHSLAVQEGVSLRGCLAEGQGEGGRGAAGQRWSGVHAGSTSRTKTVDPLVFPDAVDFFARDEIVSGGESKATRDPDLLLHADLDPPPFPPSSTTDTSVLCEDEGLTRLNYFLDLARARPDHANHLGDYDRAIFETLQTQEDICNEQRAPGQFHETIPPDESEESESDTSGTSIFSRFYREFDQQDRPPAHSTFADPSRPSAAASSIATPYPDHDDHDDPGLRHLAPTMVSKSAGPADRTWSERHPSTSHGTDSSMKNTAWRPRSAPKSNSRSPSPFLFWNRRAAQPQQAEAAGAGARARGPRARGPDAEWFAIARGESDDATHVDSVSNHLGKMAPETRSGPATSDGWGPWPEDSGFERPQQAQPASMTREEYEALPLAIQRKVRTLALHFLLPCWPGVFVVRAEVSAAPPGRRLTRRCFALGTAS